MRFHYPLSEVAAKTLGGLDGNSTDTVDRIQQQPLA